MAQTLEQLIDDNTVALTRYHDGEFEITDHDTRVVNTHTLTQAIRQAVEEIIGADEQTEYGSVMKNIVNDKTDKIARNSLRKEQRANLMKFIEGK